MADFNVEINKYNSATDSYDQLFPVTKVTNIIGETFGLPPQFIITTSSETTITATFNGVTIKGNTSNRRCVLNVPFYGNWTVTAGYGVSRNVIVNIAKQYSFSLIR